MPGKQAIPLGQIDLPMTFGDSSNFRKETLTFEVVGFKGAYHAILGRPCYAKFMAIPNYTYLRLKMPGSCGVITMGSTYQRAFRCEVDNCELASAIIASEEPAPIGTDVFHEKPDSNRKMEPLAQTEDVKKSPLNPQKPRDKKSRAGAAPTPE